MLKGGKLKLNQAPYVVKGYRLFDKVLYNNQECFISGRRSTGYFKLITLNGTIIHNSAKSENLKLLETKKSLLIEGEWRKLYNHYCTAPHTTKVTCLRLSN